MATEHVNGWRWFSFPLPRTLRVFPIQNLEPSCCSHDPHRKVRDFVLDNDSQGGSAVTRGAYGDAGVVSRVFVADTFGGNVSEELQLARPSLIGIVWVVDSSAARTEKPLGVAYQPAIFRNYAVGRDAYSSRPCARAKAPSR